MYLHIQLLCMVDKAMVNFHLQRKKLRITKVGSFSMRMEKGELRGLANAFHSLLIM